MSQPSVPVKVGDLVQIGEPDYMYGLGELRLRVTAVGRVSCQADGPWLNVSGIALRADDSQLQPDARHALIRMSALYGRPRPPQKAR